MLYTCQISIFFCLYVWIGTRSYIYLLVHNLEDALILVHLVHIYYIKSIFLYQINIFILCFGKRTPLHLGPSTLIVEKFMLYVTYTYQINVLHPPNVVGRHTFILEGGCWMLNCTTRFPRRHHIQARPAGPQCTVTSEGQ